MNVQQSLEILADFGPVEDIAQEVIRDAHHRFQRGSAMAYGEHLMDATIDAEMQGKVKLIRFAQVHFIDNSSFSLARHVNRGSMEAWEEQYKHLDWQSLRDHPTTDQPNNDR